MNIVITGASRGIGLAEAKLFDQPGNQLFLIARSLDSFKDTFKHAALIGIDLSTEAGVAKAADVIAAKAESVDILINNVGVMIMKKFEALSESDIDQLLGTNLRS